jgi:hypothetical protein
MTVSAPRPSLVLLPLLVAGLLAALVLPGRAAAASTCAAAVRAALPTTDVVAFEDVPRATVTVRRRVGGVRVTVRRAGRIVATGSRTASGRGRLRVPLTLRRRPVSGRFETTVTARVPGCGRARTSTRQTLRRASAPVRVVGSRVRAVATAAGASIDLRVRSVGRRRVAGVRATLRDGRRTIGRTTAGRTIAATGTTTLTVPLTGTPESGRYVIELRAGASTRAVASAQPLTVTAPPSGDAAAPPAPNPPTADERARQRAVVSWTQGRYLDADRAGVQLPGIGTAQIVCRPDTQWIRVFPTDPRRETSMLTWTYRDWGATPEKALREALLTTGTGRDFNEGWNKFTPAEKRSTGEFIGIVTDRGPIGAPGSAPLAAPIRYRLTWKWDFTDPATSSCSASLDVLSQVDGAGGAPVRNAQVVWDGRETPVPPAERQVAATVVPGIGTLALTCQPQPDGLRRVVLDTPYGGTVTVRQAGVDETVGYPAGPLATDLGPNSQVQIDVAGGGSVLVSSRWKLNDPDPAQNSCALAAIAEGR